MSRVRFLTAGESHGPGLTVIVEGFPAGLGVSGEAIAVDLSRRQGGYGRGGRMAIERDRAEIRGGVRHGLTLGGPIALWIENRDFANWREAMSPEPVGPEVDRRPVRHPRPGHADLAGMLKLESDDARPVLERASARETAARVAAGAIARALLAEIDIAVGSHTIAIGPLGSDRSKAASVGFEAIAAIPFDSPFRTAHADLDHEMRALVDRAKEAGDTLGGELEVVAHTPPPGLGHFAHWDRRLDGRIGQAMLSIPAAKAVAIGDGFDTIREPGSAVHDPVLSARREGAAPAGRGDLSRPTNRAGGIEGGVTNGEELRVRVGMKPLSTLRRPLASVDLRTGEAVAAAVERSDVTVVPAAGVVAEAMLALVLADAALEKFGGDSIGEMLRNYRAYLAAIGWRLR
jgi:chorismate synthase